MRRLMLLAGTAALALASMQGTALAQVRRHHHHHYRYYPRYAGWYGRDVDAVQYPYGGRVLIRSRPVPDTPYNRARFGGPMSYSGWRTAPVGN